MEDAYGGGYGAQAYADPSYGDPYGGYGGYGGGVTPAAGALVPMVLPNGQARALAALWLSFEHQGG